MLVNITDDMDLRLKDEFSYLSNKHTHIAFNYRDWNGNIRNGKEYLLATEGYITIPENYSSNIMSKFKGVLTHNRKFYDENKNRFNIILTNGPIDTHNYYKLDNYIDFDNKIDGIVSLNRIYHTGRDGDIVWLREPMIKNIPYPIKHTYGPALWGGPYYQGSVEANHANHINNLIITNKYKFVLTLEPMYHHMWSFDWVTERMWNAFKSKTIPIYYGCFNIENIVPPDLFIDLRVYIDKYQELNALLNSYTKEKYTEQTERAFNWYYNDCKVSNMKDLESIFNSLR